MGRIIKDVKKLDLNYVPEELPHREEEMRALSEIYGNVLASKRSQHALIAGKIGSGKTVLARRFFAGLTEKAKQNGISVDLSFVNCKGSYTATEVMKDVLTNLAVQPGGKQPISSMARMLKDFIGKRDSVLFVVLDEIHVPLKHDNSRADHLIYCLARINEALKGPQVSVSVCLISSRDVLSMLEGSTRGIFNKHNIVNLERYTWAALKDILVQRVELAFHPGTASEECLDLISDIASGGGDARYAIEMLYMAGMAAETESSEVVMPEHIRAAKAEIQPHITNKMLEELGEHERLLLLGIARMLRKAEYVEFGAVMTAYRVECEGRDLNPKKKTQVREHLDELQKTGLVSVRKAGRGRTARMLIAIEDAPVGALVERLEMLEDKGIE